MKHPAIVGRLLAGRDRMSVLEKEEVLHGVLARVQPRRQVRTWLAALVPAVAAIAIVLAWRPWAGGPTQTSELVARGGDAPLASLAVSCGAASCARGGTLVFDVHGTTGYGYFAAFTKRSDGTVLWFFPSEAEHGSLALATQPATGVLDRGVAIGDELVPGAYRIYGLFSAAPLTREQIRTQFDPAALTAGPGTAVITTEVEIR